MRISNFTLIKCASSTITGEELDQRGEEILRKSLSQYEKDLKYYKDNNGRYSVDDINKMYDTMAPYNVIGNAILGCAVGALGRGIFGMKSYMPIVAGAIGSGMYGLSVNGQKRLMALENPPVFDNPRENLNKYPLLPLYAKYNKDLPLFSGE